MTATMTVKVDGVTKALRVNSLSIDNAVGQRSTASIVLKDSDGSDHYQNGQLVDIFDEDSNLVYSGVIDSDDETMPDDAVSTGLLYHNLTLIDWHYLADKRLIPKTYASGQTCAEVIADLIDSFLGDEGITSTANLLSVNQSNVETDTTGFDTNGTGTITLTRDTSEHWQGSASLKVVTDGTHSFQGMAAMLPVSDYQAGKPYTCSVYLKGSGTVVLAFQRDDTFSALAEQDSIVLTSTWTRYTVTGTTPATLPTGSVNFGITVATDGTASDTFYADGLQIELGTAARTWAVGQSTFIADGVTLPDVVFNYATAAQCMDALAQKSGNYWWQIDQYKQLWFQPYTAVTAPWSLTADSNNVVTDALRGTVRVKRNKPMYRNRQFIKGATGLTDSQVETRKGDGTTTAFTMSYPLAKSPTITLNSASQTVGIKGLDTGKDWYWSSGDPVIAQDSGGTVLTSSDTLEVTYQGSFPIIVISEDNAEITAQQTLEGGGTSGKVEDITTDSSLTTSAAAFTEAAALLAKYGQKAVTLTFRTRRAGLAPGQLLSVTIPQHGFDAEDFLISSVHISDEDGQIIWYDVTALQGPVNTTWVQFFGVLVANAQGGSDVLNVGQSSTLVIVEDFDGSWDVSGTLDTTVYACPLLGTATFPMTLC